MKTKKGLVPSEIVTQIVKSSIAADSPQIRAVSSNQSQDYFAIATNQGFEIIQNDSSSQKIKKKVQILGAVELIEMMYKTNFIALVMTAAKQKVVIWDDHEKKNRTEITFKTDVKRIQLCKDMMVVVLEN